MREAHLVSSAWLADHLADKNLRLYDCTVHLRPATPGPYTVESGRADYNMAHIPGAAFLDLAADLSDPDADLRFTLPKPVQLAAALSRAGIGDAHRVVLYSATTPMWATRAWWMLRSSGHTNVQVLDGGLAKWRAEGRELSASATSYAPAQFSITPQASRWADQTEVLSAIDNGSVCTINALSSAMHAGTAEINYGRKGHIKGSVNVPYASLLSADGTFLQADALRAAFEPVGALAKPRVICYCGGGISATMDALALTLLGHPNVAVYDGSMAEWVRDAQLPMETG